MNETYFYTPNEMAKIEKHITENYGEIDSVMHEMVSELIHLDVYIIKPTEQRNYFTLVTCGMGACKMDVPAEVKKFANNRIELVAALPADWDFEKDTWPLENLTYLSYLPLINNTWLGYGHTISNEKPFAKGTKLSGNLISMPYFFGEKAGTCKISLFKTVRFHQLVYVHKKEMDYCQIMGAAALENLFPEDFNMVLDIKRKNVVK